MNVAELFVMFGFAVDKKSMHGVTSALGGIRRLAAGVITGTVLGGVGHFIEKTGDAAIRTKALADQIGFSQEQVQEWAYIAEQTGGRIDDLSTGFTRFAGVMRALRDGRNTTGVRSALQMGLTKEDAAAYLTSAKGAERVINKYSDLTKAHGANAELGDINRRLFGVHAERTFTTDMLKGSDALNQMRQSARSRGAIIPEKDNEALAQMGRQLHNVKQEFKSFLAQGVAQVAPQLTAALTRITTWLSEHRDQIFSFVEFVIGAVMTVGSRIATVIDFLTGVFDWLTSGSDTANIVLATAAFIIGKLLVGALWRMIAAMGAAILRMVAFEAPWILLAITIGLILILIAKIYKALTGNDLFGGIKEGLAGLGLDFANMDNAVQSIFSGLTDSIDKMFSNLWTDVKKGMHELLDDMGAAATDFFKDHPALAKLAGIGVYSSNLGAVHEQMMGAGVEANNVLAEKSLDSFRAPLLKSGGVSGANPLAAINQNNTFIITGSADARVIADKVAEKTDNAMRQAHADLGQRPKK